MSEKPPATRAKIVTHCGTRKKVQRPSPRALSAFLLPGASAQGFTEENTGLPPPPVGSSSCAISHDGAGGNCHDRFRLHSAERTWPITTSRCYSHPQSTAPGQGKCIASRASQRPFSGYRTIRSERGRRFPQRRIWPTFGCLRLARNCDLGQALLEPLLPTAE